MDHFNEYSSGKACKERDSMVLDNYWQIRYASSQYHMWQDNGAGHNIPVTIKDRNGTLIDQILVCGSGTTVSWEELFPMYALRNNLKALIGDGNVEPTSSDYALSSDITSSTGGLTVVTGTGIDNGLVTNIIISGTNTSNSEIIIKELGIYITTRFSFIGNTPYDVLLVHELLQQPLAVPAGKGFTLTFRWVEA